VRRAALAALAAAALAAGCRDTAASPDLARMISQRKAKAFAASPWFADGRAMRPIPEGTVRRSAVLGNPALTDGVVGGAYVTESPLPLTRALLERGRDRYDRYCATCHGVTGSGGTPVARAMELRRPPSLVDEPVRSFPPGRVYQVATRGYGLMPAYGADLSLEERWAVAGYLRALQKSRRATLDELPPPLRDRAAEELP
jgi:mono/diheme cytochrome c family protein